LSNRATSVWKLPAVSGLLYFLAFYSPLLLPNLVAFLPLLLWLDLNPEAPRSRRAWAGIAFGVACYIPGLHFHYAMLDYSWLAAVLFVGLLLGFSLKAAILTALLGRLRRTTRWSFALLLPVTWLPFEKLQTVGDTRMTADHLGQSLSGFPFVAQFADLFGTYGLGAALFLFNGLLYEALYAFYGDTRRRAAIGLAVLTVGVLGYDVWALRRTDARIGQAETIRVAIVQPNIPILDKRSTETNTREWEVLERLTREGAAQGAELIVWPESARPWPVYHVTDQPLTYRMPDVQRLALDLGVTILTGVEYGRGETGGTFSYYNAALLVHPDGRLDERWGAKVYLVPFTEGVPFPKLLGPLVEDKKGGEWRWVTGGFTPGPRPALLPVGTDGSSTDVGVLVCYEQLFYDLSRDLRNEGAGIQAVITNDAWWGRSLFQKFQADVLRLRAIENRTAFIRAANTGISGFVDPAGRYEAWTPLFEEVVVVADVPITSTPTLYNRVGDLVVWVALAGLVAAGVAGKWRRRNHGS
jgi:apolipoprotein N-acyltransferase